MTGLLCLGVVYLILKVSELEDEIEVLRREVQSK